MLTVAKDREEHVGTAATPSVPPHVSSSRSLTSPEMVTPSQLSPDSEAKPNIHIESECRRSIESLLAASSVANLVTVGAANRGGSGTLDQIHRVGQQRPGGRLRESVPWITMESEDIESKYYKRESDDEDTIEYANFDDHDDNDSSVEDIVDDEKVEDESGDNDPGDEDIVDYEYFEENGDDDANDDDIVHYENFDENVDNDAHDEDIIDNENFDDDHGDDDVGDENIIDNENFEDDHGDDDISYEDIIDNENFEDDHGDDDVGDEYIIDNENFDADHGDNDEDIESKYYKRESDDEDTVEYANFDDHDDNDSSVEDIVDDEKVEDESGDSDPGDEDIVDYENLDVDHGDDDVGDEDIIDNENFDADHGDNDDDIGEYENFNANGDNDANDEDILDYENLDDDHGDDDVGDEDIIDHENFDADHGDNDEDIAPPVLRRSKRLNASLEKTDRIDQHGPKETTKKKPKSVRKSRRVNSESRAVADSSAASTLPDIYNKTLDIERVLTTQWSSGKLWLKIKWKGIRTASWEPADYMRSQLGEKDFQELLEIKPRKRRKKASAW
jgi:hypothetical protein